MLIVNSRCSSLMLNHHLIIHLINSLTFREGPNVLSVELILLWGVYCAGIEFDTHALDLVHTAGLNGQIGFFAEICALLFTLSFNCDCHQSYV